MNIYYITNKSSKLNHFHIISDSISCKIFPNLGASLQELTFKGNSIIDGITIDKQGFEDYQNTYKSALLFPSPNRVKSGKYQYKHQTYQFDINEKQLNNRLHGLIFDKHFTALKNEVKDDVAIITLSYSSNGNTSGFPFKYKFDITYKISNDGDVNMLFEVENIDEKSFPFGLGWHPYFAVEELQLAEISFDSKKIFNVDSNMIPTESTNSEIPKSFTLGDQTFDDGFEVGKCFAKLNANTYTMEMNFENDIDSFIQFYTPPHRQSIAIEPMTCPADSFNNKVGLLELNPNENFSWNITMKITA